MGRKQAKSNLQNRSIITHINPKSPISEQYRTVRTNIQFSAIDQTLTTLMITSASPSEGKSTTIANMAIVFAQQGKKVLLVDADMRKPTVHYTFRLENTVGLTNVLTKQSTMAQAVKRTDVDNVAVLTSGPIPPNPAELLGSQAMQELMSELTATYDLVLFDTPPVLAVTDAQILANRTAGVILVVSSGKTEVEAATKAKELLVNAKGKLLGVVLNQKKRKGKDSYYYYYGTNA